MATILIVDDRAENRSYLETLLRYAGHDIIEASDGAIALTAARARRPDLIVTDVLMPTMDGYELVRALRADPKLGAVPVIFTSAHYLDREAAALARACGVQQILPKPSEPEVVLQTVAAALTEAPAETSLPEEQFEREHSGLVRDKLREKTDELRAVNEKMTVLIDTIQRAATEREPLHLLSDFCHAARNIIGAQVATLYALDSTEREPRLFTSGLEEPMARAFQTYRPQDGPLSVLLTHPGSLRLGALAGDPSSVGLPPGHPPVRSVAAASISSPTRTYGWMCLTNKLGFDEFSDEDERLIAILAAQLGRMYENGKLYRDLQRRTVELEHEIQERKRSEARFRSLIENASDLIATVESDGTVAYASPSHERVFGSPVEEIIGHNAFERVLRPDRERVAGAFERLLETGETVRVEFRHQSQDGGYRVIESIATNLVHDPAVGAIVVNSRDITDRKKAEEGTKVLLRVATAIGGAVELDEVVSRIQREIAETLPCDFVALLYRGSEAEAPRLLSLAGIPAHLHALAQELALSKSELARHRLLTDEVEIESETLAARFGLDALFVAPLRTGSKHLGALLVGRTKPATRFAPEHLDVCRGIASQLAIAISVTELYRANREDAAVASAVAGAGEELIVGLDRPGLLERVCHMTMSALGCDLSWTLLRVPESTYYVATAIAGATVEQVEETRHLRFPTEGVANLLAGNAGEGVLQVGTEDSQQGWDPLARRFGCSTAVYVPLRRGDEVIGLLAAGLRDSHARFAPAAKRIARRLGHLASLALEAARLIENLEQANRLKSDFVATMSHELRTPMNIIMGYNDLLLDATFGPLTSEQERVLQATDKSARQLLELINSTLDLNRLESGHLPVAIETIDVASLLETIRDETRNLEKQGVKLVWPDAAHIPPLRSDPLKLKIILKNVLQNAVKFTAEGRVVISVRAVDHGVEIAIADTGIGIAPEDLDLIFEPFRQLEGASTRHYGGVGLGLYLVRRMIDLLGGNIAVESTVGTGSTFRVNVPSADD